MRDVSSLYRWWESGQVGIVLSRASDARLIEALGLYHGFVSCVIDELSREDEEERARKTAAQHRRRSESE